MSDFINIDVTQTSDPQNVKLSSTGKILIGITGGIALGLSVLCIPFVSPALRKFCLPYIPATDQQITNVLSALRAIRRPAGVKLIDLGSGDGRIVLETARCNYQAHGVELNLWLVLYSRLDAFRKGLRAHTAFYRRDLWKFDISGYDNVVIFGVEQMMAELENKMLRECKQNCCIVACRFPLPNLHPVQTIGSGVDTVWLYEMPRERSAR